MTLITDELDRPKHMSQASYGVYFVSSALYIASHCIVVCIIMLYRNLWKE